MGVVYLQHRCRLSLVCSPSLSTRYKIPAAVHILNQVYFCSFCAFRASFRQKSQDASAEIIVKLYMDRTTSTRWAGRWQNHSDQGTYPQGVEFTFSARPYFFAHAQLGAGSRG